MTKLWQAVFFITITLEALFAGNPPALSRQAVCPYIPPVTTPIETKSFYTDKLHSIPDIDVVTNNQKILEPVHFFTKSITRMSDAYYKRKDLNGDYKSCIEDVLRQWAKENALVQDGYTSQGEIARLSALAAISSTYIKLGSLNNSDSTINRWLAKISDRVISYEEQRRNRFGDSFRNLDFWAAYAIGSTSMITGDQKRWLLAKDIVVTGINRIQSDGTLPDELGRGERSLKYHVFAAEPLVAFARLAELCGQNLWSLNNNGLDRIVNLIRRSQDNPDIIKDKANQISQVRIPSKLPVLALAAGRGGAGDATGTSVKLGGYAPHLLAAIQSSACPWK